MTEYTDHEVKERIEQEGLEYAVRHYMGPESIQNPLTKELWANAAKALDKLATHLGLDD